MASDIHTRIDNDLGLQTKRKMLTVVSVILLAIELSGATVSEANTFILKLTFEHQKGIPLLLTLSLLFLLVRYYNYAIKYHIELHDGWVGELLHDPIIAQYDQYSEEYSGFLHEKYPKDFSPYREPDDQHSSFNFNYNCSLFLQREFHYFRTDEYGNEFESFINIRRELGFIKYIRILFLEIKHQVSGFFIRRENLDIMGPYLLGILALCSFVFSESLVLLIAYLN